MLDLIEHFLGLLVPELIFSLQLIDTSRLLPDQLVLLLHLLDDGLIFIFFNPQ